MKYYMFYGEEPFSQWTLAMFSVDGVAYSSAEQYMMSQKARLFDDVKAWTRIMGTQNPAEQKAVGRAVRNFDKRTWEVVARDVVRTANYAKFTQNPLMLRKLIATAPMILVEASPTDAIWGIGLGMSDPGCQQLSKWRGRNWLGQILTEVRDSLL